MAIIVTLGLAGCTGESPFFINSNQVTLEMHTKMFDFSTGQIVTEEGTTEDLDIITGADEGKARLISRNNAEIKISGEEEYHYYIDASVGDTCVLVDNEGGTATFTVDSIGTNSQGFPTATITWSYTT